MIRLTELIESSFELAEIELKKENLALLEQGNKEKKITETMIVQRAFRITLLKDLYHSSTFPFYENKKSFIFVPKHNIVYDSGNNYSLNFYKDERNKIGWEIIRQFDANQASFIPQWKQNGFKPIWSVQQGDTIELTTPEQWKKYTSHDRCLATIKKLQTGFTYIKYQTDARAENRNEKDNLHIKQDFIGGGLSFFTKSNTCKIELTPFGKIKRRHIKLWDGKEEKTK